MVLEDRFSNQARESSKEIRRLHQEAKNITNANLNVVNRMATAGMAIGSAAAYGIGEAVLQGAKFIDTMTFVKAIAKDTGTDFSLLSQRAKTLGKDTMFTSQDIGSAMQYMAMAGQGTTEIFNNITAAADLANATMSELGGKGGAADIMTNIMKMFMIDSTEANSTRVSDVLTRAVTRSNTNLYDLGEAIKYAGTTTTNLGATLEQTAAAIGVLGDAGIQGSMAGTALANAYRYLSKSIGDPNFKGGKALAALGLSKSDFIDANGQLIDLGLALQKIANASRGLGELDQYNLLVNILGVRGERAGSTMIRAFQNYTNLLDELDNNSQGAAASVREQRMASLAGAIETVQSTWENLTTSFAESLGPTLTPWLRGIGKILEGVQAIFDSPIGPFVSALVTGTVVLGTINASVIALKSSMRLLFNDSTVSLRNMFLVMKQGWKASTISAAEYAAMQRSIIAQGKAGLAGRGVGNAMLYHEWMRSHQGQYLGKVMGKEDKTGRMRYYAQTASGGTRRISEAVATRYAQRYNPLSLIGGGAASGGTRRISEAVATRYAQRYNPLSLIGGAAGAAAGGAALRFGASSVMRGALAFFGGPWGLALSAIITFLPMIITALNKNNDQSSETNSLLKATLTSKEERQQRIDAANLTTAEREVLNTDALVKFYTSLDKFNANMERNFANAQPGTKSINIYLDGNLVGSKAINEHSQNEVIEVGGK